MNPLLEFLKDISPVQLHVDALDIAIDYGDVSHAIQVALAASSTEPYILLEQNGRGLAFDSKSSSLSAYWNSYLTPEIVDGVDQKKYLDRICASVRSEGYDTETLRSFFNRIEFYCYVICKFRVLNGDQFYNLDSDTQIDRIKMLVSSSVISSGDRSILRELAAVRNIFAHTLIDIDEMTFRGAPLKHVLTGLDTESHKLVSTTMRKLIVQYDELGPKQVNWDKFVDIFEAIIGHTTLIKSEPHDEQ